MSGAHVGHLFPSFMHYVFYIYALVFVVQQSFHPTKKISTHSEAEANVKVIFQQFGYFRIR